MASDEDDLVFTPPPAEALNTLSIEELRDYITDLTSEIEKAEKLIGKKKQAEDAANSIFKT